MFRGQKYEETVALMVIFFLSITGLEIFILQKHTNINTNFFMLWLSIGIAFYLHISWYNIKIKMANIIFHDFDNVISFLA